MDSVECLEEAARSLRRACEQIGAAKAGPPAEQLVTIASGYVYEPQSSHGSPTSRRLAVPSTVLQSESGRPKW